MRTLDPNIADVFIIPVLFGLVSNILNQENNTKITEFKCNGKLLPEMMLTTSEALLASKYFSNPSEKLKPHLIVASHYRLSNDPKELFFKFSNRNLDLDRESTKIGKSQMRGNSVLKKSEKMKISRNWSRIIKKVNLEEYRKNYDKKVNLIIDYMCKLMSLPDIFSM